MRVTALVSLALALAASSMPLPSVADSILGGGSASGTAAGSASVDSRSNIVDSLGSLYPSSDGVLGSVLGQPESAVGVVPSVVEPLTSGTSFRSRTTETAADVEKTVDTDINAGKVVSPGIPSTSGTPLRSRTIVPDAGVVDEITNQLSSSSKIAQGEASPASVEGVVKGATGGTTSGLA